MNWKFWILIAVLAFVALSIGLVAAFKTNTDLLFGVISSDSLISTLAILLCSLPDKKE